LKSNPCFVPKSWWIALLGMLSTVIVLPASSVSQPQIRTRSGVVSGVIKQNVLVFKGIPFAQPPIGQLRWRPPQAVKPWRGVRSATAWGHICMQEPSTIEHLKGLLGGDASI
jgi:para-nitrobenzyl esterase